MDVEIDEPEDVGRGEAQGGGDVDMRDESGGEDRQVN